MSTEDLMCDTCGAGPFEARIGLVGHSQKHKAPEPPAEPPPENPEDAIPLEPIPVPVQTKGVALVRDPLIIFGSKGTGYRTIKMAYPRCLECQPMYGDTPGWWYLCERKGHNPYFTPDHYGEKSVEELGPPDADGAQEVIRTKTIKVKILGGPNIKPMPYTGRHNTAMAMQMYRGKGYRLPEEIGVAPMCQYSESGRDCYAQDGTQIKDSSGRVVQTLHLRVFGDIGTFCNVDQYKAVMVDQRRSQNVKFREVLNEEKRRAQWDSIPVPA